MKLAELAPRLFRTEIRREIGTFLKPGIDPLRGNWTDGDFEEREHDAVYLVNVETLAEADGVTFLDPGEFRKNGGPVGTGSIHIPFKGRGDRFQPSGWQASGTSLSDLTISPSIFVNMHGNPPGWHGWIRNGEIVDA